MGFCPQLGGVGPCPAQCIWQGSGFAADQTNAILAVVRSDDESFVPPQAAGLALSVARPLPTETASLGFGESPAVGGDKSSRKRKPLHLLEITAYAEEFSICGREMKCFFIRFSRGYFPCTQCFFGTSMWGWYHYPRRALRVLETPDGRLSKRLICRFLRLPSSTPCAVTFSANIQISLSVISVANAFALWYDKSHKSGLFGDEGEPE